jgi:hypothetical protein
MAESRPVAAELLRYVDEYIQEEDFNRAVRSKELDSESNLIVFYRELFAQVFANVVGEKITGMGARSGEKARELYERHAQDWSHELCELVRDFQHFCKIYPDLLGDTYGGSEAVADLHFSLLPQLLMHLEDWAINSGETELATAVAGSRGRYSEFAAELEPAEL